MPYAKALECKDFEGHIKTNTMKQMDHYIENNAYLTALTDDEEPDEEEPDDEEPDEEEPDDEEPDEEEPDEEEPADEVADGKALVDEADEADEADEVTDGKALVVEDVEPPKGRKVRKASSAQLFPLMEAANLEYIPNPKYTASNNTNKILYRCRGCDFIYFRTNKQVLKGLKEKKTPACRICAGMITQHLDQLLPYLVNITDSFALECPDIPSYMNQFPTPINALSDRIRPLFPDSADETVTDEQSLEAIYAEYSIQPLDAPDSAEVMHSYECMRPQCVTNNPANRYFIAKREDIISGQYRHCDDNGHLHKNHYNVNNWPEKIQAHLARKNGQCLSPSNGVTSQTELEWKCKQGHTWKAVCSNVVCAKSWCPTCKFATGEYEKITRRVFESIFDRQFESQWLIPGEHGKSLELDGYEPGLNLAFEYHGKQHYEFTPPFLHETEEDFHQQQRNDAIKAKWCKDEKIDLVVIPYWIMEKLENENEVIRACKKFLIEHELIIKAMHIHHISLSSNWINSIELSAERVRDLNERIISALAEEMPCLKLVSDQPIKDTKQDIILRCLVHDVTFATTMVKMQCTVKPGELKLKNNCHMCYAKLTDKVSYAPRVSAWLATNFGGELTLTDPNEIIDLTTTEFSVTCSSMCHKEAFCVYSTTMTKMKCSAKTACSSSREPRRNCAMCSKRKTNKGELKAFTAIPRIL